MTKTIGILGGMGPESTVYLFNRIVNLKKVDKDQDHLPIIIFNNPQIPDRTEAIINNGNSPLPALIESAILLEKAGADFILMPCVTAHYYYENIIKHIGIPIVHLLDETTSYTLNKFLNIKKIGLLATTGTIQSGMFQERFNNYGINIVTPSEEQQYLLMNALYQKEGLKTGHKEYPRKMILKVLQHLLMKGIDAVIAGCTEIPLILEQSDLEIPYINPLEIVANRSILLATAST